MISPMSIRCMKPLQYQIRDQCTIIHKFNTSINNIRQDKYTIPCTYIIILWLGDLNNNTIDLINIVNEISTAKTAAVICCTVSNYHNGDGS